LVCARGAKTNIAIRGTQAIAVRMVRRIMRILPKLLATDQRAEQARTLPGDSLLLLSCYGLRRMGLASGSRLGSHEIVGLLGAGGMGEAHQSACRQSSVSGRPATEDRRPATTSPRCR